MSDFKIHSIKLEKEDGSNFLAIDVENNTGEIFPYPLFKVVSNNEIVAESQLQTYGLAGRSVAQVPTSLSNLPSGFSCTVILTSHASTNDKKYEISYPS